MRSIHKGAHLNGRKPPMAMCTTVCLYQGWGGICRAMLRVRQGAWKLPARFFPTMPPMTVRGKPTSTQAPRSRSTVVAGRACVEPLHQWMELTTLHVRKSGAGRSKKSLEFIQTTKCFFVSKFGNFRYRQKLLKQCRFCRPGVGQRGTGVTLQPVKPNLKKFNL